MKKLLLLPVIALASAGALAAEGDAMNRIRALFSQGYLDGTSSVPADTLPPPPAPGSAAGARDYEGSKRALALRDTPRWELAKTDADIFTEAGTRQLSCAAGVEIGPQTTPKTHRLMQRLLGDFAISTRLVKEHYKRPRPFMVNGEEMCTPDSEAALRFDGSYPSGHSALGYGWGLVLAQALPERAAQLVKRGRAFGDSRRVCNVHWLSDVEEGRVAATVVFARLQSDDEFRSDLAAVRKELLATKAPPQGCDEEAAALALTPDY